MDLILCEFVAPESQVLSNLSMFSAGEAAVEYQYFNIHFGIKVFFSLAKWQRTIGWSFEGQLYGDKGRSRRSTPMAESRLSLRTRSLQ